MEKVVVDAIARSESSVVAIGLFRVGGIADGDGFGRSDGPRLDSIPDAYGTGVVLDRRGLILTNYHVLREESRAYVRIGGQPFWCTVRVKAADPLSDLAVLEIIDPPPAKLPLRPIVLGDGMHLKRGQIVIALGNPYAIARDGQASAAWGIVSNLGRRAPPTGEDRTPDQRPTMHHFGTLIQTDARLNWGTSGGALLNLQGEMIGLTTSLAATSEYEQAAGYAIPIDDTFRRVINTLKEGREVDYGFLGVMHEAILAGDLQPDRPGLYVKHVTPGGPAARAGLSGGEWITHIGGRAIHNFDDLRLAVGRYAAGDGAPVIYERRSERGNFSGTANIVLGKYHRAVDNKAREAIFTVRDPAWRGMTVDFASIVDRTNDGLPTRVVTAEVAEDSAAYQAGVRSGMFIASIGATPIDSPAEFRRTVQSLTGEVTVTFIEDSRFREFPRQQLIAIPAQPRAIDPPVKK